MWNHLNWSRVVLLFVNWSWPIIFNARFVYVICYSSPSEVSWHPLMSAAANTKCGCLPWCELEKGLALGGFLCNMPFQFLISILSGELLTENSILWWKRRAKGASNVMWWWVRWPFGFIQASQRAVRAEHTLPSFLRHGPLCLGEAKSQKLGHPSPMTTN